MLDQRFFKITVAVLLMHAGLLYLVQSGMGRKITEAVISPEIVASIIPLEPPPQRAVDIPRPKVEAPPKEVKVAPPKPHPAPPKPVREPVAALPPSPTAIEAPSPAAAPAPPAPPAPVAAPEAPAPVSSAPRAVGIGEIQCSAPQPTYPSQSRRMGETGKAVIRLTTDEAGKVVKTAVVTSSGSSRLDQAAVDAVQRMRCKPYLDNGRPVAVTAQQPIGFELN